MAYEDLDRFIGIADAAERLGISRSAAYRLVHDDEFPIAVHDVAGRKRVSLRRIAEYIYGDKIDRTNDAELEQAVA